MKRFSCILVFSFFLTFALMGQGKIAQIIKQKYDGDSAVWITQNRENWEYDAEERETLYTTWTIFQGAYVPHNNTRLETTYHPNGEIATQKMQSWGELIPTWTTTQTTFQYNANKELTDIFEENEHSENEGIFYNRTGYEANSADNQTIKKSYFQTQTPDNWQVQHQRDSFFNEDGCLTKQTIINYDEEGTKINQRWWTNGLNDNCTLQSSGYWLWDETADSMYLSSRHQFTYENNGKTKTDLYEKFNRNTGEWQTEHLVQTTTDSEGREIRYFYENYGFNYIDTLLKLSTYTVQGELASYREYKTAHLHNDKPLYLVRFDTLTYVYDAEEKLVEKREITQHYNNPSRTTTTRYDYYCNGQLKTEIIENLPSVTKITYEYYGNTDCFLAKSDEPNLSVFPNPSDGNFTIKSNLLATLGAEIALYSVTGQVIFSQKVNRITNNFYLEIPNLNKGHYILTIGNDKEVISEKVVVW